MHLHKERTTTAVPVAGTLGDVMVTLTRPDLAAIDLALRVLLAVSTPRDKYFVDVTRVRARLTCLSGSDDQSPRDRPTRMIISPERVPSESR